MRYFWALVVGFGCAVAMASCSGDDGEGDGGGDSDGPDGFGGSYSGLGGSTALSLGGTTSSSGGGSANAPGRSDAPCTEVQYEARVTPINLIFVWDKSGSMGDGNAGDNLATRWIPARDGLGAFLADPGSSELQASLKFFPVDGSLEYTCDINHYLTPDVPLMPLESNTAFMEAINATTPAGGTPTYPALQGAVIYARQVWEQNRDQISVIVLVTDGRPEFLLPDGTMGPGCENNDITGVTQAARDAYQGTPPIPVYVFGIGPDLLSLHSIASAGGTGLATIISDTSDPQATRDLFLSTLEQIRAQYVACNLRIPEVPAGEPALDFDEINVNFITGGGQLQELLYDADCAQGTGWQYPGDNRENPGWIELCPDLCASVQSDAQAELEIQVGCVTRSVY